MPSHFRLALAGAVATPSLIALLRQHTGKSISELRQAIATQRPFLDETPHHNQYSEFIARATRLLDELDAEGIKYVVEVDGSPESPQYIRNTFQRWNEIRVQTMHMIDLESGEPCIETLEWLQENSPQDVFRQTLKQIVGGNLHNVDEGTLAWAKQQLERME